MPPGGGSRESGTKGGDVALAASRIQTEFVLDRPTSSGGGGAWHLTADVRYAVHETWRNIASSLPQEERQRMQKECRLRSYDLSTGKLQADVPLCTDKEPNISFVGESADSIGLLYARRGRLIRVNITNGKIDGSVEVPFNPLAVIPK